MRGPRLVHIWSCCAGRLRRVEVRHVAFERLSQRLALDVRVPVGGDLDPADHGVRRAIPRLLNRLRLYKGGGSRRQALAKSIASMIGLLRWMFRTSRSKRLRDIFGRRAPRCHDDRLLRRRHFNCQRYGLAAALLGSVVITVTRHARDSTPQGLGAAPPRCDNASREVPYE